MRFELSGYGHYNSESVVKFVREAFSYRAKYNPVHWTVFAALVCPLWAVPMHVARIWGQFCVYGSDVPIPKVSEAPIAT